MTLVGTLKSNDAREAIQAVDHGDFPILFTHPGSGESTRMRNRLAAMGVPFRERSVTDQETADELAATGVFMTPLLIMGGQIFTNAGSR